MAAAFFAGAFLPAARRGVNEASGIVSPGESGALSRDKASITGDDEKRPDEKRAEENRPEVKRADEKRPEEKRADENRPDENRPDEKRLASNPLEAAAERSATKQKSASDSVSPPAIRSPTALNNGLLSGYFGLFEPLLVRNFATDPTRPNASSKVIFSALA